LQTQAIGKEILGFHEIYSAAFLLALNLFLPRFIVTPPDWAMNLQKISKGIEGGTGPIFAIS